MWRVAIATLGFGCTDARDGKSGATGGYRMPSASMLATIGISQRVVAEPLGDMPVARGDVIVFRMPEADVIGRVSS
jgi:hypothetical protein